MLPYVLWSQVMLEKGVVDGEAKELFFPPCDGRHSTHLLVSETLEVTESL